MSKCGIWALMLVCGTAFSQEAAKHIRDVALNHSQIMQTVEYLSDVAGPRLTGSPNLKRAEEYARDRLREWGVANARLEAWGPFGRGWSLEGFAANVVSPGFSPLIGYPKAWSPGTNGMVRGEAVYLDVQTAGDLDRYKGKLKGRIVLFSPAQQIDPLFAPPAQRRTDGELQKLANAEPASGARRFQFTPEQRAAGELNDRKWELMRDEGAAVVLQPSYRDAGTVYVTAATVPYAPDVLYEKRAEAWDVSQPVVTPQVVVAAEQYNRMVRLMERGIPVEVEVNLGARFYEDDPMSYNVIGEIPGTDLKDEVVMIGGCIDSWHAGTGATDNAAGAATALEVMRILQSVGLKPRRTIRIGLWSGEEQGRLGSRAYAGAHLKRGTAAYEEFDAYFNFDYGTGRIRGIYLQGNEGAKPVFRTLLAPFEDLGAGTVSSAGIGATDHISFDEIGLPGFQWIRDYMEGDNTRAPHTNMDTYDHVLGNAASAQSFHPAWPHHTQRTPPPRRTASDRCRSKRLDLVEPQ
jgi:carboxypeptidase Q